MLASENLVQMMFYLRQLIYCYINNTVIESSWWKENYIIVRNGIVHVRDK